MDQVNHYKCSNVYFISPFSFCDQCICQHKVSFNKEYPFWTQFSYWVRFWIWQWEKVHQCWKIINIKLPPGHFFLSVPIKYIFDCKIQTFYNNIMDSWDMCTLSIPLGYGGLIPQGPWDQSLCTMWQGGVGVIDFFHFFWSI